LVRLRPVRFGGPDKAVGREGPLCGDGYVAGVVMMATTLQGESGQAQRGSGACLADVTQYGARRHG
jgi:hypothetical protein